MRARPVVNSYDEWTQLEEVIVGTIDGFEGFHLDSSFNLFYWDNLREFLEARGFFRGSDGKVTWPSITIEQHIIEELREDVEDLVESLQTLGVRVRRPAAIVGNRNIRTPFWESTQSAPLNVRDQALILGSTIVETAPHVRARLFENDYLKPIFLDYMKRGARWMSMPRPTLSAGVLDASFFTLNATELDAVVDHHAVRLPGLPMELIFDGAQCIRLGKDVLVNVGNRNHELGLQWLQGLFGDTFVFHRLDRISDSHVDTVLLPLRPGMWLVRHRQYLEKLPRKFQRWDSVVAPEANEDLFPSYRGTNMAIASKFIDMNVLSINEETVIVNSLFPELMKTLEGQGFVVVPVRNRHRRLFGGGFHCFTLDVCRAGKLEAYAQ